MDIIQQQLLQTPVAKLPLSADCKNGLKDMKIYSLEALSKVNWQDLLQHEKFSYVWFNELVKFLDKNSLLYLLDQVK